MNLLRISNYFYKEKVIKDRTILMKLKIGAINTIIKKKEKLI